MMQPTRRDSVGSRWAANKTGSLGFTLVELMVALAIGSVLLIGATTIYVQGRSTFRVTETVSRLQEDARYVIDTLEPDIRMASYFGLHSRPGRIKGRATPLEPVPPGLGVSDDCGTNWSINLVEFASGDNNGYGWNTCPAFGNGAQPDSDTLVIRRGAEDPDLVPASGTLYVQAARFQESQIFEGPIVPAGYNNVTSASYRLISNGYYVSQSSDADSTVPSLRMKTLVGTAAGPAVIDQEILPGVEDMQIQFGVDTDAVDTANRGSVNRYVNPGDPIIDPTDPLFDDDAEIIAVRIWLRIRSDLTENGFFDTTNYVYADQDVGPFNDSFRRIVVSKTIFLRNARQTT